MSDTPNLCAALVKAVAAAKAVGKEGYNDHHKYAYATAESMIDEGRAALASCGLTLLVTDVAMDDAVSTRWVDKRGEVHEQTYQTIACTYVLVHDSGETLTFGRTWPIVEQAGRPFDRAQGGAQTTALAYTIRDVLMLPRDDDRAAMDRRDDTAGEEPASKERAPAASKPANDGAGRGVRPSVVAATEAIAKGETPNLEGLGPKEQEAVTLVKMAFAATTKAAFGQIGSHARKLPEELGKHVLAAIRPAYDKLPAEAAA